MTATVRSRAVAESGNKYTLLCGKCSGLSFELLVVVRFCRIEFLLAGVCACLHTTDSLPHFALQVWLLLMLKNGRAACVGGTLMALVVGYLSYTDILPGWQLGLHILLYLYFYYHQCRLSFVLH